MTTSGTASVDSAEPRLCPVKKNRVVVFATPATAAITAARIDA